MFKKYIYIKNDRRSYPHSYLESKSILFYFSLNVPNGGR